MSYCVHSLYSALVSTKPVDSAFRAPWLAPKTRNILGYLLFCEWSEMEWKQKQKTRANTDRVSNNLFPFYYRQNNRLFRIKCFRDNLQVKTRLAAIWKLCEAGKTRQRENKNHQNFAFAGLKQKLWTSLFSPVLQIYFERAPTKQQKFFWDSFAKPLTLEPLWT